MKLAAFRFPVLSIGSYLLLASALLMGAESGPAQSASKTPLSFREPVQDKNFFLLSLIEDDPASKLAIENEPTLAKIASDKIRALAEGSSLAPPQGPSVFPSISWSAEEIETAAVALRNLYDHSPPLRELVEKRLRAGGTMQLSASKPGRELLADAWRQAAAGMNNILQVYGAGTPPKYHEIDSLAYEAKSPYYVKVLSVIAAVLQDDPDRQTLFFQPTLHFAVALLIANSRDEAGRMEPLEKGENKAAFERVALIKWDQYPYPAILCFGIGPDRPDVRLSPFGFAILPAIAKRYAAGKAPFIVLSGGYVHPAQTTYCEALEMKKALMAKFHIPENAIIIDPQARHTTTNFRNTARLLYRYGFPLERKTLVTSNPGQIHYIDQAKFQERCQGDLGYVPFEIVGRPGPLDLESLLKIESLQANPLDPLDP